MTLWLVHTAKLPTNDVAVSRASDIANRMLAPAAGQNDKAGRFSTEAVKSLGESGLLGLMLPVEVGGSGLGRLSHKLRYHCRRIANANTILAG